MSSSQYYNHKEKVLTDIRQKLEEIRSKLTKPAKINSSHASGSSNYSTQNTSTLSSADKEKIATSFTAVMNTISENGGFGIGIRQDFYKNG